MTRARAKQISLAVLNKPHVVRWDRLAGPDVGYVSVGYVGDLHAMYNRRAEAIILEVLLAAAAQVDPNARITQVHDEILVGTTHMEAMKQIVVDALVTQYGVQIIPPRSLPMVDPA